MQISHITISEPNTMSHTLYRTIMYKNSYIGEWDTIKIVINI